jgi:phage tail tape-measure protein
MQQIKKDAVSTPFDVQSLAKGEQMLISTGISADDARNTILALGDAVSATGGDSATLTRMIANLQQIQNARKSHFNGHQTICLCRN